MSFRKWSGWLGRSPRILILSGLGSWGTIALIHAVAIAQSAPVTDECNQFADGVNRNQEIMATFEAEIATFAENAATAETLAEITDAASQYVDAVASVTGSLDALANDLDELTFADTQLTDYRDEYVTIVAGFNTALVVVSDAMTTVAAAETEDQLSDSLEAVGDETAAAIGEIETLAIDESELIDGVNAYCSAE